MYISRFLWKHIFLELTKPPLGGSELSQNLIINKKAIISSGFRFLTQARAINWLWNAENGLSLSLLLLP